MLIVICWNWSCWVVTRSHVNANHTCRWRPFPPVILWLDTVYGPYPVWLFDLHLLPQRYGIGTRTITAIQPSCTVTVRSPKQATFILGNLQTLHIGIGIDLWPLSNILCIYIHTIGHGHQHGDRSGIRIGLKQGMSAAVYKVLWHRQATLIHGNLQSVSALATNSYLW